MGTFLTNLRYKFKQKDILIQLILINVIVFLLLAVLGLLAKLFKLDSINLIDYLGVSSNVAGLLKFWTPFTYMFVHQDILHILFNMLLLYWFGQMFLAYFNPKILGSLYVLGGLAGAFLYILAFNTIPYYVDMGHVPMIGASASVMAIIFGVSFYRPDMTMRFFLIGQIKVIYIAVFFFILDFFALGSDTNPGGHVAHIGGAILGYCFAIQYQKGRDITRWLTRILDSLAGLSKPRRKVKLNVKFKKREEEYRYNERKNDNQAAIDRILDKIKVSGYDSLTKEEKQQLFNASRK